MTTELRRPTALSEQLVRVVEGRVRRGQLPQGARLPTERELCAEFAVSRAVVREAIARLRADGYVETRQGAGAFVPVGAGRLSFRLGTQGPADRVELRHVMELRLAVEVAAAELAARRHTPADLAAMQGALAAMSEAIRTRSDGSEADDRFHAAIAAATRNPHLRRFVEFLRHQFGATRRPTWSAEGHGRGEPRLAQREHERLFAAIRARDGRAARRAARAHLVSSARRLRLVEPSARVSARPRQRPREEPWVTT
jgi:GntR family transcriptional repressor for pyruvate dehydrogenase complex